MCKGIDKPGIQYVELETQHEGDLYGGTPTHMSPEEAPQEPMGYNFKIAPGRYQVAEINEDGEIYIALAVQLEAVQDRDGNWMGISKGGRNIPIVHTTSNDPTLACHCPTTHPLKVAHNQEELKQMIEDRKWCPECKDEKVRLDYSIKDPDIQTCARCGYEQM